MRQPIVLQVEGLGVPVVISGPTAKVELRWSSDPDISADAPVYLFRDSNEVSQFLSYALDKRFMNKNLLQLIRVEADPAAQSLPRAEAEAQGVSPLNWDLVRAGLIISGNSNQGPKNDALEWLGTREDYSSHDHLRSAFEYATRHSITAPIIVTHNEAAQTLAAAEYMTNFHHSIKPQSMIAQQVMDQLTSELYSMDLPAMAPDRAKNVLIQVRSALIDVHDQVNQLRESLGLETRPLSETTVLQTRRPITDVDQAPEPEIRPEPEPSPEFFTSPRMG